MSNPCRRFCPYCGSSQLIAHRNRRKVFIAHDGERIPLLTVNFSLDYPVIEEHATIYSCNCPWEE